MIKVQDIKIFAFIWAVIFVLIGYKSNTSVLFIISVFLVIIGQTKPQILNGFYNIWIKIGDIVGNIVSKIIMFVLYFVLFTPIAMILRLLGKDLLNKKLDKSKESYWIDREIQPQSMKNQF